MSFGKIIGLCLFTAILPLSALTCMTGVGGSGGGGGGIGENANSEPVGGEGTPSGTAFTVFLSSSRARLIRGDQTAGRAELSAEANQPSEFQWFVRTCPSGAEPCLIGDEDLGEQITCAAGGTISSEGLMFDCPSGDLAIENTLRILDVPTDPGAVPQIKVISVRAISGGGDPAVCQDDPSACSTRAVALSVERPDSPLAVSIPTQGLFVIPGESVDLMAEIQGGTAATTIIDDPNCPNTAAPADDTPGDLNNERRASVCPPNNGSPYRVVWQVIETPDPGAASGQASTLTTAPFVEGDSVTIAAAQYDSPASPGTARFTVEVTDGSGNTASAVTVVRIGSATPLQVSANADPNTVDPEEGSEITVAISGGNGRFLVEASQQGNFDDGTLSCPRVGAMSFCDGIVEATTVRFDYDAPAAAGTAEIEVTVTDLATDDVASTTVFLPVGSTAPLTVIANADSNSIDPVPAGGTVGASNSTTINVSVSGGNGPYELPVATLLEPGLTTGVLSPIVQLSETDFEFTYTAPSSFGTARIEVEVTDALMDSNSTIVFVTVGSAQPITVAASAPSQIAVGGTAQITVSVSGGNGQYTVTPSQSGLTGTVSPPSATGVGPTFPFTYTGPTNTAGTAQISFTVNDSLANPTAAVSTSVFINVGSQVPLIVVANADPSTILPDDGVMPPEESTITASASGGNPPYTFSHSLVQSMGLTGTLVNGQQTGATFTIDYQAAPPMTSGSATVSITAKDAANNMQTATVLVAVGSDVGLAAVANAAPGTISPAGTSTITVTVIGGDSPYTIGPMIQGLLPGDTLPVPAMPPSSPITLTFTAGAQAGLRTINIPVSDSGGDATSATVSVDVVAPPLSVAITTMPPNNFVVAGNALALTATPSGGIAPYTFSWTVAPPVAPFMPNSTNQMVTWNAPMVQAQTQFTFTVAATDSDATGASTAQAVKVITVVPELVVGDIAVVLPNPPNASPGDDIGLSVSASGGVPGYTFDWTATPQPGGMPVAMLPDTQVTMFTFTAMPGEFTSIDVQVVVTDVFGNSVTRTLVPPIPVQ